MHIRDKTIILDYYYVAIVISDSQMNVLCDSTSIQTVSKIF
jgi:hypothetical protein